MLCVCVAHVVVKAARDARVAEGQAERAAQARVRAARHTDLPLLLARVAELGAIAAGGDAIYNNNNFLTLTFEEMSVNKCFSQGARTTLTPSPHQQQHHDTGETRERAYRPGWYLKGLALRAAKYTRVYWSS